MTTRLARWPVALMLPLLLWCGASSAQSPPPASSSVPVPASRVPGFPTQYQGMPTQQQGSPVQGQEMPTPGQGMPTVPPAAGPSSQLPERSRAETYFARPPVPVGEALGGPGRTLPTVSPAAAEGEAAFFRLLAEGETLPPLERVTLFLQLEPERQRRYLNLLSPEERRSFIKSMGEGERWFGEELVGAAVDLELKQFGYDFFAVGDAFAADSLAPVGADYVIGPGDTLRVDLWGGVEGSYELTVDRQGEIVIPRVGSVRLWGQTFPVAQESIRRQVARYYNNFELNVGMGALRSVRVYLVGEVGTPGTYTVSSVATVLNALAAAGGPAKTGSLRNVQLVRQGAVVSTVDFYEFFLGGDRTRDLRLQSGDTIYVPMAGQLAGVAGDVRRPAIYELKQGETLGDLLRMAGGFTPTAYLKKIQVERVEAHRQKVVLDLDLSGEPAGEGTGLGFALQDRDLVKVGSINPARSSYVRLKGYVAHPGSYQLIQGMRLSDLLTPYDNLLPDTYFGLAEVLRMRPPAWRPERIAVSLEQALAGDPEQNLALSDFDEVTIFSRPQMEEIAEVQVGGAVQNPGSYRFYEKMSVRDLIAAAGNLSRGAYLGEAELTRTVPEGRETRTERMLLDLEKALAGEPQHNLPLRPDDRLFVRAIPDFAQKLQVRLEGEVLFPGNYTISPGERLSSLLERAGGFSDKAYPRGAVFTRESLKAVQRQRLEKLIFEQEQEIYRASAEIAQGALSAEEAQSAGAILEGRKQLLQKLKQTPVSGRMVVRLRSAAELRGSDDDIELFNGDTLQVPQNPQSVSVLGQVYNPISLAHRSGKTVSWYLGQVGGPTHDANVDGMFVIRADGTVYSRQQGGVGVRWDGDSTRWVFGGFNSAELYPGDTILVPEQFKRYDFMREFKDLTTIFYQMALGAAAVASF